MFRAWTKSKRALSTGSERKLGKVKRMRVPFGG